MKVFFIPEIVYSKLKQCFITPGRTGFAAPPEPTTIHFMERAEYNRYVEPVTGFQAGEKFSSQIKFFQVHLMCTPPGKHCIHAGGNVPATSPGSIIAHMPAVRIDPALFKGRNGPLLHLAEGYAINVINVTYVSQVPSENCRVVSAHVVNIGAEPVTFPSHTIGQCILMSEKDMVGCNIIQIEK